MADTALADASAALRAAANTRTALTNRQNDITARRGGKRITRRSGNQ